MRQSERPRVLVAGGGIGGLATAVALRHAGIAATVLERAPRLAAVGAGIQIAPNAVKALRHVDLAEPILAHGTASETFQFRSWTGRVLTHADVGELARRHGAPAVFLSRADLLRTLYEALEDGTVRFGADVVGVDQDARSVTVTLADGSEERADLLVGADGVGSRLRERLFGTGKPVYAGYQDWRAIVDHVPADFPPATWWMAWGRGGRFGLGHAGPGRLFWFALLNTPEGSTEAAVGGKEGVLDRFAGWTRPIEEVIAATPESAINWADIRDMRPLKRWSDGRVTLLGDAAHATTPNLGRGAGEAIEDAVVLASRLACVGDFSDRAAVIEALYGYERARRGPTARVTRRSRRMGRVGQLESATGCRVREAVMRLTPDRIAARALASDFKYEVAPLRA